MQSSLKGSSLVIAGLLFICLVAVYSPVLTGPAEFIADDYYYVLDNEAIRSLSPYSLAGIWSRPMRNDYFPVTITSFAVERALYGLDPRLFRFTNLVLFYLIVLLSFSLSVDLNKDLQAGKDVSVRAAAFFSAVLMAFHPVNVESIAAIANRKELLYVLLGLLSFRYYAVRPRTIFSMATALVFMVLAQFSKGTAVVLPLVFLVYELLEGQAGKGLKSRLLHLLPFFFSSALVFSVQWSVALQAGVITAHPGLSVESRIGGIVRILNTAVQHVLLPLNLTYDYEIRWPDSLNIGEEWVLPLLMIAGIAWFSYKRRYRILFFAAAFLIPLLPYLSIVPLTGITKRHMVYYDHYLLFSCMAGPLLLTRWSLSISGRWKIPFLLAASCLSLIFMVQDNHLAAFWKTRETLYKRSIAVNPRLPRAYYFLGQLYIEQRRCDEAANSLSRGLSLQQDAPDMNLYPVLGDAYSCSGNYLEAEKTYRQYLAYRPNDVRTLQNLSGALIMLGKEREAKEVIKRWLLLSPEDPAALHALSLLEKSIGGR